MFGLSRISENLGNALLGNHRDDTAAGHVYNYIIHDVLQNFSGPPASGNVLKTFKVSVVTA